MAELMTYNLLMDDVQSYINRNDPDFVAQIPRLIMMAENRIAARVRGLGFLKYAQFELTTSEPTVVKPVRWRETAAMSIIVNGETKFLTQRNYQFCRTFWPDQSQVGVPDHYSDYDYEHWLIAATPDTAYEAEVAYYERPLPLDATNQTNWTTRYAPQLILYATLLEAQPWIKREDRLQIFKSLYDEAVNDVTTEAMRRINGDSSLIKREG